MYEVLNGKGTCSSLTKERDLLLMAGITARVVRREFGPVKVRRMWGQVVGRGRDSAASLEVKTSEELEKARWILNLQ